MLHQNFEDLSLPASSVLIQYEGDLMICSPTEEVDTDTVTLLKYLAEQGHKASLSKLQLVSPTVTFLGHEISEKGKSPYP